MAKYIYSRVSTDGQTVDAQLSIVKDRFPDAQVVSEIASGGKARPILNSLISELVNGDYLIVASLDRLGRRTLEILSLIENLERRGVILVSVREGVDYSTPAGRLVIQILISVSELERSLISERTKAGLKAAKERGSKIGKPATIPKDLKEKGIHLVMVEGWSTRKAAKEIGVSPSYMWLLCKSQDIRI